jgi:hypothetical protein
MAPAGAMIMTGRAVAILYYWTFDPILCPRVRKPWRFDCEVVENIHIYRYIGISHAYVWRIKAKLW